MADTCECSITDMSLGDSLMADTFECPITDMSLGDSLIANTCDSFITDMSLGGSLVKDTCDSIFETYIMETVMMLQTNVIYTKHFQVRQLTYTYTCPATVLHTCLVTDTCHGDSLVIHIVGARSAEVDDAAAWSLLTASLPNIKRYFSNMIFLFLTLELFQLDLGDDRTRADWRRPTRCV